MLMVKDVAFQYINNQFGLSPTSLDIPKGSMNLITGPSGSGKSTLARCLNGLVPQLYQGTFSGEVRLNGYNTTLTPMWQLSEAAGMVFQNPAAQMLAHSVEDEIIFGLENLGLGRDEITRRLNESMDEFDLADMKHRAPLTLSGGEQQKLALAAVAARSPDVFILDEPLSMLDSTSSIALIEKLEKLARNGSTVIMFEHRQEYLNKVADLHVTGLEGSTDSGVVPGSGIKFPQQNSFTLEIIKLKVQYGSRVVIRDLNLSLPNGELVAIVGRNGVGKTTLLRAIVGLNKYDGRINLHSPKADQEPDLGIVFQNPDLQLFNPTVRDEILYRVPTPDLDYYHSLINALGLRPYEDTPPLLLSEGEKKRLALGLVLMHKPAHGLLLDEPSLGQDKAHKVILIQLLRSLADAGGLVIMTTHDLSLASQADRLILLGPSGIIEDGETKRVLRNPIAWEKAGIVLPDWLKRKNNRENLP